MSIPLHAGSSRPFKDAIIWIKSVSFKVEDRQMSQPSEAIYHALQRFYVCSVLLLKVQQCHQPSQTEAKTSDFLTAGKDILQVVQSDFRTKHIQVLQILHLTDMMNQ